MKQPVISNRVPYLPIHLQVGTVSPAQTELDLEALVDTGFDGGVSIPRDLLSTPLIPITHHAFKLADATEVMARVYLGHVTIGNLPAVETLVITLGDEVLLGRRVIDHFKLIFDHGNSLSVEQ